MFIFLKKLLDRLLASPTSHTLPSETVHVPTPTPKPRVTFRATDSFLTRVRGDLMRRHAFAHERVGFITVRAAQAAGGLILIAEDYYPVADEDYINDRSVGAMMGAEALRKALDLALLKGVGVFHVHMHGPSPHLWFSTIDLREQLKFIPDFFKVCPQLPHGALVLDSRGIAGRVWFGPQDIRIIDEFTTAGPHLTNNWTASDSNTDHYA